MDMGQRFERPAQGWQGQGQAQEVLQATSQRASQPGAFERTTVVKLDDVAARRLPPFHLAEALGRALYGCIMGGTLNPGIERVRSWSW